MSSTTPRTDDQEDYGRNKDWADFARNLERELNTAVAMNVIANGEIKRLNARIRRLEDAGRKLCEATDKEWLSGTDLEVLCEEWSAAVDDASNNRSVSPAANVAS